MRLTCLSCPGDLQAGVKSLCSSHSPASPEQPQGVLPARPSSLSGFPAPSGPLLTSFGLGPNAEGNRRSTDFA